MIQPNEMKLNARMDIAKGVSSTTTKVWEILSASYYGDPNTVKRLVDECPALIYAQYNYTPPIHFAVREGHAELVKYLLDNGALDPTYRIYPFLDNLLTIAQDREYNELAAMLGVYNNTPSRWKYKGDNGKIHHPRIPLQLKFQKAVNQQSLAKTDQMLKENPDLAQDEFYFWGEGILAVPANNGNIKLLELLLSHNVKIPPLLKWAQAYYFKHYEPAALLMNNGMDPNIKSWQEVTLLHDMAQKGFIPKADLLIKHGAQIDPVDDEYQSTPLGLAARWGHTEMVDYLLKQGADPNKSGAAWATPLAWARKKGYPEIENKLIKAGAVA